MTAAASGIVGAVVAWRAAFGEEAIKTGDQVSSQFTHATTSARRQVPAVLQLNDTAQIALAMRIAKLHRVSVYPISSGRNWGYGCGTPAAEDCVIFDLSSMNRIVSIDSELGVVTVQPGVTQGQLHDELVRLDLPFLVPVTGAGPRCSLLGNALERGYGITPEADHFASLMSIEAVLPNGEIYRSALSELGGELVDRAYKWGIGPYLDGLFTQSNLGIVTEVTIALSRRPEAVEAFFFWIRDDEGLEAGLGALREAKRALCGVMGSVNVLNPQRILSMTVPFPEDDPRIDEGRAMPADMVKELAAGRGITAWTGVGGLYGTRRIVAAAKRELAQRMRGLAKVSFVGRKKAALAARVVPHLPFGWAERLGPMLRTIQSTLDILDGRPSEVALRLAYWRARVTPQAGVSLDPGRDGCGIIWYAPLVPHSASAARSYVELVKKICGEHGIDPLITLTLQSERCIDSSVPILFNLRDQAHTGRARACHAALLEAGRAIGCVPYRISNHAMDWLEREGSSSVSLGECIKRALDPEDLLQPGRYARDQRNRAPLAAAVPVPALAADTVVQVTHVA